tara:strand:- start:465 stop:677 length:213 start_codon:yes stop_codon:yes gene_type:complete
MDVIWTKWLNTFRAHLRALYGIDIAGMIARHPEQQNEMGQMFIGAYTKGVGATEFAERYGLALTQSANIN